MEGHLIHPFASGEAGNGQRAADRFRQLTRGRTFSASLPLRRVLQGMAVAGALTLVAGALLAPQRTWANLLLAGNYVLGLSLAGLVFVALQYVCGASWSTAFRRVPESMAAMMPWAAAPFALILAASPWLYPWFDGMRGEQPSMWFKELWLSPVFFVARSVLYLAVWLLFGRAMIRISRRQDEDGEERHTRENARLSAVFLVVFGFTFWLAGYDWIMSLEPHWYSTIFAVYQFAGLVLSGLAMITILAIWLEKQGPLKGALTHEHLHDLGKLLFAFSTFWMYIWFCQYMLIWYANIPEETVHYVHRLHGFWEPAFLLNFLLNWAVPFLVLLHVPAKRSRSMMLKVCWVILVGRWVDLYLMIMPPIAGEQPVFGVWEVGVMLGAAGLFFLAFFRVLPQANAVPTRDPFLSESLTYHN